jgi:hypothetical protein
MNNAPEFRAFLTDTLALWRLDGIVEPGDTPVVAVVRVDGAIVWIEEAPADAPYRWGVRWRSAGEAPGGTRELRPRTCGSIVGVLSALRTAFDLDRGTSIRIAPARSS